MSKSIALNDRTIWSQLMSDLPTYVADDGLLRRMGYRGHLSIELFNRAYWEAPLSEVVERCYRGLAGLLAVA